MLAPPKLRMEFNEKNLLRTYILGIVIDNCVQTARPLALLPLQHQQPPSRCWSTEQGAEAAAAGMYEYESHVLGDIGL